MWLVNMPSVGEFRKSNESFKWIPFSNGKAGEAWNHILFELFVYTILFIIGAVGNLMALIKLSRQAQRRSHLNVLITQLTIADLIVILVTIPAEVVFDLIGAWNSHMFYFCQLLQTLRTMGFYLSSMVLTCISIDRLYAFVYPLKFYQNKVRTKKMLIFAWASSILLSIPQVEGLVQCVTYGYLKSKYMAALINIKSLLFLYFIPLLVIVYCYARIICVIYTVPEFIRNSTIRARSPSQQTISGSICALDTENSIRSPDENLRICNSKQSKIWNLLKTWFAFTSSMHQKSPSDQILQVRSASPIDEMDIVQLSSIPSNTLSKRVRRLTNVRIQREVLMSRAKRRTLRLTAVIVVAFVICWTPYVTMALWYQLNEASASQVNEWVQELFFLLAVANSCVNPIVYTMHM